MNTILNNIGLTANGNQYKKSKAGSRIGTLIGAVGPAALSIVSLNDGFVRQNGKIVVKDAPALGAAAAFALFGIVAGFIGKAIGNTIDAKTNKERMLQADGEAAIKNLNK